MWKENLHLLKREALSLEQALSLFLRLDNVFLSDLNLTELINTFKTRKDWENLSIEEKMRLLHVKNKDNTYLYRNFFFYHISQSNEWRELSLEKAFGYIFTDMDNKIRKELQDIFLSATLASYNWEKISIEEAIIFAQKYDWPDMMNESINRRIDPKTEKIIKKGLLQKCIDFFKS